MDFYNFLEKIFLKNIVFSVFKVVFFLLCNLFCFTLRKMGSSFGVIVKPCVHALELRKMGMCLYVCCPYMERRCLFLLAIQRHQYAYIPPHPLCSSPFIIGLNWRGKAHHNASRQHIVCLRAKCNGRKPADWHIFFHNTYKFCTFLLGQEIANSHRLTGSAVLFHKPITTGKHLVE